MQSRRRSPDIESRQLLLQRPVQVHVSTSWGPAPRAPRPAPRAAHLLALLFLLMCALLPAPAPAGEGDRVTSLSFTFSFDPGLVRLEQDQRTGYSVLSYDGLQSIVRPEWIGAPMLPGVVKTVLLPEGMQVARLSVLLTDRERLPGEIVPVPIPPAEGDTTADWGPDNIYYQDGAPFPPRPDFLNGNTPFREFHLADFAALPFEYDGRERAVYLYRTLDVRLDLEPARAADNHPPRLRRERIQTAEGYDVDWVRANVHNPQDLDRFYVVRPVIIEGGHDTGASVTETTHATGFHPTDRPSLEGPAVEIVIVTADQWANGQDQSGDMVESFQRLADWRIKTGHPAVVRSLRWIRQNYQGGDDPERIRNFIKDAYALWGTDYVVLGGDHRAVPSRIVDMPLEDRTDAPSDWYYACLDGDWNVDGGPSYDPWWPGDDPVNGDKYPELWVGRLPARDTTDADAIIDKLLVYERSPDHPGDGPPEAYYTRATIAAGVTTRARYGPDTDQAAWFNGIYYAEHEPPRDLRRLRYVTAASSVHAA